MAWSVSRDPFFNFDARSLISGTTEATVAKFCMQVEYIKCFAFDDRLLPNGRGQGHVSSFFKICPNHIFGIGEARHFKFCVLIDTQDWSTSACIIYYPQKGCDVSRDLLKFWETSDNISSTMQDRDIVATEHLIGNCMWHHCQCPWMMFETFRTPIPCEA